MLRCAQHLAADRDRPFASLRVTLCGCSNCQGLFFTIEPCLTAKCLYIRSLSSLAGDCYARQASPLIVMRKGIQGDYAYEFHGTKRESGTISPLSSRSTSAGLAKHMGCRKRTYCRASWIPCHRHNHFCALRPFTL